MSPLALRKQIGQLLIAGFDGHADPGRASSRWRASSASAASSCSPATSRSRSRSRSSRSRPPGSLPELPAWVSVDQEGGRVARLKAPFTEWPPMATLGRSGDVRLAERFARALAVGAAARSASRSTTRRCSTSTPTRRTRSSAIARWPNSAEASPASARAIVRALQAEGVAACGKHFPGHGDTSADSHHELPLVEHPPERLRAASSSCRSAPPSRPASRPS